MSFIPKIQQIIEWVDFLAIEAVDGPNEFEPGLALEQVAQLLESREIAPVDALVELYSWSNGCDYVDGVGITFVSLEKALDHFDDWHPDYGRPRTWFPVATMNGDVWIYLDLETLALHSRDVECDITLTLADHYDLYLDAIIEGVSSDGAHWDEEDQRITLGPQTWFDISQRFSVQHPWL